MGDIVWFGKHLHIVFPAQNGSDCDWKRLLTQCLAAPAVLVTLPKVWLRIFPDAAFCCSTAQLKIKRTQFHALAWLLQMQNCRTPSLTVLFKGIVRSKVLLCLIKMHSSCQSNQKSHHSASEVTMQRRLMMGIMPTFSRYKVDQCILCPQLAGGQE